MKIALRNKNTIHFSMLWSVPGIVGLRAAFQKVVATLEKALKDNQQ
jgi:hypothetical protein